MHFEPELGVVALGRIAAKLGPAARVDAMLFTMLPGETITMTVTAPTVLDHSDLFDPRVLRHAGQLITGV